MNNPRFPFVVSLLLAVVFLGAGAESLQGSTFTVTKTADTNGTCNSGVDCSFREAVKAANTASGADTITFAAGVTGTIGLGSSLPDIVGDLTIQGPGAGLLEITRSGGVFSIFTVQGNTISFSGIAITNGHAANSQNPDVLRAGGAIEMFFAGSIILSNCTLSGNTGDHGGGAIDSGGAITLTNCVFSNNSSGAAGGAIQIYGGGNFTATGCTFSGNSAASDGGAVTNGNTAFNFGTGFGGAAVITGCTFNNNSAARGAGIFNYDNSLTIKNSTVASNTASSSGGGIENVCDSAAHPASASFTSCTIAGNSGSAGGGIYNNANNTAAASVALQNTILQSTAAMPGANLVNVNGSSSLIVSGGYNLSSDNAGGLLGATGDQVNVDPMLAGLQNNGGPTATMTLQPGSPALDKGKSFGLTTDQRGQSRPLDIPTITNAPAGDGSDIGAAETDLAQSGTIFFNVNTTDDHNDGACTWRDCSLREAINASNGTAGANIITFAASLSGTIALQSPLGGLTITDSVTILGPGARTLAVSGNEGLRIFSVSSGLSTISGLTIRDGWNSGFTGDGASRQGGAIYNQATLSLADCSFDNNFVQGANNLSNGGTGGSGQGGAVYNNGSLGVTNCTFAANGPSANGNVASGGNGQPNAGGFSHGGNGGPGQGGAIFCTANGNVNISDCTFSGNSATGGAGGQDLSFAGGNGGDGGGGAICNLGAASLVSCTIASNVGTGGNGGQGNAVINNGAAGLGSGGIVAVSGSTAVDDTICALNAGNHGGGMDVLGTFGTGAHNLIGSADHSSGFGAGDQIGTDASPKNPFLMSLGNYGGNTDTLQPFFTSSVINAGDGSAPHRDQRGYLRNGIPDIGAFEFSGNALNLVSVTRTGMNAGDIAVSFEVVRGMSYSLQRKFNLTDSQWLSLPSGGNLTATGNDTEQIVDPGAVSLGKLFYRVQLQP